MCLSRDTNWNLKNNYVNCYASGFQSPASRRGRPDFISGSVHVRFVVDKVTLRQDFSLRIPFLHIGIIPQILHTYVHLIFTFLIQNMNFRDLENFEQINALSGSTGQKNTFTFFVL